MESKEILKKDYLDILFEGRNKSYGGYELRKKYPMRMLIAGLIGILSVCFVFGASMIKKKEVAEAAKIKPKEVKMAEPPPINENKPPPPPPPPAPPPVRPTVKFTPPVIKKNEEVKEEEKPEPPKPKENVDVGKVKMEGDPGGVSADLGAPGGTGDKPAPVVPPPPPEDLNKPTRNFSVAPKPTFDVNKYLRDNIKYPQPAIEQNIQGTIVVEFVVNLDGSITDVRATKELGGGLSKEAVRVVNAMPKWTPGRNKAGNPQAGYFKVPVTFKLQ